MFDNGYILAAYIVSAVILGGGIAYALLRFSKAKAALARAERMRG